MPRSQSRDNAKKKKKYAKARREREMSAQRRELNKKGQKPTKNQSEWRDS